MQKIFIKFQFFVKNTIIWLFFNRLIVFLLLIYKLTNLIVNIWKELILSKDLYI